MKQIHLRLDKNVYNSLEDYSIDSSKTIQDCVREAVANMLYSQDKEKIQHLTGLTFIDLFAGIGGMRLAFELHGASCIFSSEWDKYCQKTYLANFGEIPKGDIKEINEIDIPDHDILIAGFPCQPFSIAGVSKKNSMGVATGFLDQTQGTLFFDVVRIIKGKRPKTFLLENVKNLKSHDKGNTWNVIINTLKELNYNVFTTVINGKDYVPQNRERVFIVGFDRERYGDDIDFEFEVDKPKKSPQLKNILLPKVDEKYTLSDRLWIYLQNYAEKHRKKGNGFGFGMADLEGTTRTLSARYYKDGSEILIPQENKNPRRLTPRECARLQGFPDSFKIVVSDTQAYKQFGNSVVVPVIEQLAGIIIKKIKEIEEIEKYLNLRSKRFPY